MSGQRLDPFQIVQASYVGSVGAAADAGRDKAAKSYEALPPPTSTEVAFAGRSNVGKSSLINTLVERHGLVRTSSTPGSTRQINVFEARARDAAVFRLVDLPGYGFTRRSKSEQNLWASLIEGYLNGRVTLGAVVLLVDARRGLLEDDLELIQFVENARQVTRRPVQLILVATKIDKLPSSQRKSVLSRLAKAAAEPVQNDAKAGTPAAKQKPRAILGFSSVTGDGRRELWAAIRRATLGSEATATQATPSTTSETPTASDASKTAGGSALPAPPDGSSERTVAVDKS
ncbi:ribosome biogenesis GTP-binding protein YihA/YsxC [Chondromyces crocatus]|uniref:Probable GTP-binding protein EngB n=1 Tax=Chondromyces crocatus TaxID=52 RepID=A0A0K1E7Z9_CHOCO|nr:ribosome biogenesis GTP-binding protein YihA/YsxC [Chondromyces crocatus]AKT36807.1 uncharacterized protein CMC5_009280 [Chondromyces crocatus]